MFCLNRLKSGNLKDINGLNGVKAINGPLKAVPAAAVKQKQPDENIGLSISNITVLFIIRTCEQGVLPTLRNGNSRQPTFWPCSTNHN